MLDCPGENYAHGIEKLLLKTQVSEKFLHSEVNLITQYILVQDQDGKTLKLLMYSIKHILSSI